MVNAYFLDSSALVKRYIPEIGSAWLNAIASPSTGNLIIISRITWVEVLSALARRQGEGSFSEAEIIVDYSIASLPTPPHLTYPNTTE